MFGSYENISVGLHGGQKQTKEKKRKHASWRQNSNRRKTAEKQARSKKD